MLGGLYGMACPLLSLVCDERREALANTAICGWGEAVGVKPGADPVGGGHQ